MSTLTGTRRFNGEMALAAVLLVGAAAYLHYFWPRSMVGLDEGAFLYEAKRALDGEVMYRDFFDLIGPTSIYLMALVYAIFGVSMETARWSMAILHGVIVVLAYATARRLGVRPILAAVVSLTHIALFYPGLAFASPHWIATLFSMLVFWVVLRGPVIRPGTAVAAGVLSALVALTQQPKGAGIIAAALIVLIRDAWTARQMTAWTRLLARQLAAYAIGGLALAVPTLVACVAAAGFGPVYEALVWMPLVAYPRMQVHAGGGYMLFALDAAHLRRLIPGLPPMLILNLMPWIIPVSAARLLWQTVRGVAVDARRPLFVAVVFSALAIVSVFYQPNYFHFGIVGPIWLSLYAELLERGVQWIEQRIRTPLVAPVAALAVLFLVGFEMRRSLAFAWHGGGVAGDTAFGRVHFRKESLADEVAALRTLVQEAGAKDILVYPTYPGMYLMTDTSNPTRFQLIMPGYTTAEQYAEVQATLERERVPFVVRTFYWWGPAKDSDPLLPYLRKHYVRVKPPRKLTTLPSMEVMRRKPDDGGSIP